MNKIKILEVAKRAAEEVSKWPLWKQNLLNYSSSPYRTIPRKPIKIETETDEKEQ